MKRISVVVLCVAIALISSATIAAWTVGATGKASGLITGADIKNGAVGQKKLSKAVVKKLNDTKTIDNTILQAPAIPGVGLDGKDGQSCNPCVAVNGKDGTPGGPQGIQGEIGPSVTFDNDPPITTLPAGSNATVSVLASGSPNNYALVLGIPRGNDGAIGPVGPSGSNAPNLTTAQIQSAVDDWCSTHSCRGIDGTSGAQGKSAYELWLDSGHSADANHSLSDFFESLRGPAGAPGGNGGTTAPVSADVNLIGTGGANDTKSVSCPSGQTPTGGGYNITTDMSGVTIKGSYPTSSGWNITYTNTLQPRPISLYVICMGS